MHRYERGVLYLFMFSATEPYFERLSLNFERLSLNDFLTLGGDLLKGSPETRNPSFEPAKDTLQ